MADEKEVIKKKKSWYKKWWGILIIIFGVIIAISIASSSDEPQDETEPARETKAEDTKEESEAMTVKVNEDLTVGEVRWKVLEVSKSETIAGSEFSEPTKAGGVFIIVKLEAELLGKESGTVDSNQLEIVDSQDRTFESSSEGGTALTMEDKETLFLKQVNPNVPISGYGAFDVAKDATGLRLKVDDLRTFSDEHGFVDLGI